MRIPLPSDSPDSADAPAPGATVGAGASTEANAAHLGLAIDLLFANAPLAMALLDTKGRIVHVNRAYESLFGWSAAELARMTFRDFTHPEDHDVGFAEVQALRRGEVDSCTFDKRYCTREGREIRGRVTVFVVRDATGRTVYTATTVRDVTDEHAAQRRAEDWQRRYETAILANRQVFYDLDIATGLVVWAGACEAILGRAAAELGTFEDWANLVHPEDRPSVLAAVDNALASNSDVRLVYRILRHDGASIWLEDSAYLMFDQQGRAQRMTGFVVDVTERVLAEQERRRQEERFRLAAAVMNGFVWEWNLETGHVWRSHGLHGLSGYSADELGQTADDWFALMHPDDSMSLDFTVIADSYEREYRVRHRDGRWIIVWDRAVTQRDEHGRAVRLVGAAVDITDRHHSAEEIRRLNMELERRVLERTGELVRTNRELEAFSYSVSHDLRAPLRHIAGFADLLQQRAAGKLDPQSHRYLSHVLDASARMGELLDRLLDLSHLGRATLKLQPVDPSALVRELANEFAAQHPQRAIEWRIDSVPAVTADPSLLRVVLSNLLHNAVKYTGSRSTAVIEFRGRRRPGDAVEFELEDNGVGFDMRYADRLFGVFERLHPADQFEGWGVGLASVQRIVARHGGTVAGVGEPGRGARFTVTLPAAGAH
jgi:PAS domain S-box-containing protein